MSRDRVSAGIKAAISNQMKRPDYYSWIAKLRGLKLRKVKYNDDLSSDRIMANTETIEYKVSLVSQLESMEARTMTFATRKPARNYKKLLAEAGFKAQITQIHYIGDLISEQRIVR